MRKTSTIIGLAMAIILTAYMSVLTLSNQAFAQPGQIQTEPLGWWYNYPKQY